MKSLSSLSLPRLDDVLSSNWWPIILPIGYALFRFIEYLIKRKLESRPENEKIEQYSKLAELQKKLDENNMSIRDLNRLRSELIGNEAQNAISIAKEYNKRANLLASHIDSLQSTPRNQALSNIEDLDLAQTSDDLNFISSEQAKDAQKELEYVILRARANLTKKEALLLDQAQKHWIAFRDIEIKRESARWEGASIRPLLANALFEAMTRERIASIQGGLGVAEVQNPMPPTPRNLFQVINIGTSKDHVKNLLGPPNKIIGHRWEYSYKESQFEILFHEDEGVQQAVIALRQDEIYDGYNPITDISLGQLTLADLLDIDHQIPVEYRQNLRTQEVFVHFRPGPPEAWEDYYFGALSSFSGAGNLHEVNFEWDKKNNALITDAHSIFINWIGISISSDPPGFNWFIR